MAELPEIMRLARDMQLRLAGRALASFEARQDKCLDRPAAQVEQSLLGARLERVSHQGKWIRMEFEGRQLFLSLGMGADVLYFKRAESSADKWQIRITLDDASGFTCRFWWFGHVRLVGPGEVDEQVSQVAMDPLDDQFTQERLLSLLAGRRTRIKQLLLDQKAVGGIGNMYMHDILFEAGLHPNERACDLSEEDAGKLLKAMRSVLRMGLEGGGWAYEVDFLGERGVLDLADFAVGYREGLPCPACGAPVQKIKTGATQSYLCPHCQRLKYSS